MPAALLPTEVRDIESEDPVELLPTQEKPERIRVGRQRTGAEEPMQIILCDPDAARLERWAAGAICAGIVLRAVAADESSADACVELIEPEFEDGEQGADTFFRRSIARTIVIPRPSRHFVIQTPWLRPKESVRGTMIRTAVTVVLHAAAAFDEKCPGSIRSVALPLDQLAPGDADILELATGIRRAWLSFQTES